MPEERFDILFQGVLIDGQDPAAVRQRVGRLFKVEGPQLERLFSGKSVVLKRSVDLEAASRYRLAFRQAGALLDIRLSGMSSKPKPLATPATAVPALTNMTLLPANTGSLEDCAPPVIPMPLPDLSGLGVAALGMSLDLTPPAPPRAFFTGYLELVSDQDWSLEDCASHLTPPPLPNIDLLELAPPAPLPAPSPLPAPPLPDISLLALTPEELER